MGIQGVLFRLLAHFQFQAAAGDQQAGFVGRTVVEPRQLDQQFQQRCLGYDHVIQQAVVNLGQRNLTHAAAAVTPVSKRHGIDLSLKDRFPVGDDACPESPGGKQRLQQGAQINQLAPFPSLLQGIDPLAFISPKAKVGKDCYVGAFAYIGDGAEIGDGCQIYPNVTIMENVKVGDNCLFYPHVSIYYGCHIGNNVTLHSGAVIGADGFGFAPNPETNQYDKIPQLGIVTIEDNVEIGANTCIDRSTMGTTTVRTGVKLDNLVQIAHNTDIGENTVMSAQVGVAGSTTVGQWCMFGGQVGISGHIKIGDRVLLGAQSGAPSSLESNQTLIGTPPVGKMAFFRSHALVNKLPELYKQLNALQKEVEELKKNASK